MRLEPRLRAALAAATDDVIVYDLPGIAARHAALVRELPGVAVRFAMKACPVDEVLATLAAAGAGFDAASPDEIAQAARTGVPLDRIHYGNTIKSDRQIAAAHALGVRDFATDSLADVAAIAEQAPGARVFCRLATGGEGALWGLSRKFGCSVAEARRILAAARAAGLTPAGLSVHVGSQQLTAEAWREAFDTLAEAMAALAGDGITLDHVNLGGGLPALGCLDRYGRPLEPPLDKIFAVIREGAQRLRELAGGELAFVIEPGRHLVADHGAIRARVIRLTERQQPGGERDHWLYLSCSKFNGLYEMDELRYPLVFPDSSGSSGSLGSLGSSGSSDQGDLVPAVIAGPTCDSDDAYDHRGARVAVPAAAASGDPVWLLACGAYATSYQTQGFNGFRPLPYRCIPLPEEEPAC